MIKIYAVREIKLTDEEADNLIKAGYILKLVRPEEGEEGIYQVYSIGEKVCDQKNYKS